MLISAKMNIQPKLKIDEKIVERTLLKILLEGFIVLIRLFVAEICEVKDFAASHLFKNAYIRKNIYMIKTKSIR